MVSMNALTVMLFAAIDYIFFARARSLIPMLIILPALRCTELNCTNAKNTVQHLPPLFEVR
ncbi:hypothetical protein BX661DRAFT_89293 [Kickxella alabastrina]|uniref:uncharacterized protein n=1 Tax=Kickxella alabastrina TaxID=61397 RepID=UPI00221E72B7|nr:uncharacterized protein BX661DRAFT_89293 [Kickxella alabastrina]KAI7830777.1 hypothetical protein BX661DRAFT_89293 [Kickxella alabastrina]